MTKMALFSCFAGAHCKMRVDRMTRHLAREYFGWLSATGLLKT